MNKKYISLFFILFIFLLINNCKRINSFFKKNDTIIVSIDKAYSETFEGKKVTLEITKSFLKGKKLKYKILKSDNNKILKNINDNKIHIGIVNLEYNKLKKSIKNKYLSRSLFSDAVYILSKENHNFNYPNSIYYENIGIIYESNQYKFIINKFGNRDNFYIYYNLNNMLLDFDRNKTDIIIIGRNEYYKNIMSIPAVHAYYFNIGKPYRYLIFTELNLKENFNIFINNKQNNYDWSYIIYKKPKKITLIEKYFK